MPIEIFPDPKDAGEDGLLAVGGDLHPDSLLLAYRQGIFPWPVESYPLIWFCPSKRGVLFFKDLKISKSLSKAVRQNRLTFTFNKSFKEVITGCATVQRPIYHPDEAQGTWITSEMLEGYIRFHKLGFAHSVEAWDDGKLVGGLYGVYVEGVFSGESMFYLKSNASKLCLLYLIEHLKKSGVTWMDIQQLTPHMKDFGGIELERDKFLNLLKKTQRKKMEVTFA